MVGQKHREPNGSSELGPGLRWRRKRIYAFTHIPTELQPAYSGRTVDEKTTGTDSPSEANTKRKAMVAAWESEFTGLRAGGVFTPEALAKVREDLKPGQAAVKAAMDKLRQARMRETFEWLKDVPYRDEGEVSVRHASGWNGMDDAELGAVVKAQGLAPTPDLIRTAAVVIDEADTGALNLYNRGRDLPPAFSDEPIDGLLDTYFDETHFRDRQRTSKRKAIEDFIAWMKDEKRLDANIGRVTKELAGEYVTARLKPIKRGGKTVQRGPKTVKNEISAISAYWNFLVHDKSKGTENPFARKAPKSKVVKHARIKKRAFTPDEVWKLLSGDTVAALKGKTRRFEEAGQMVADAIRLLACHGLRAEELAQLRVGDCKDNLIRVYGGDDSNNIPVWHENNLGKNESARRTFPWHLDSVVTEILKRRTTGKADSAFLIHELTTPSNPKWERSQRLEKFFRDYRRSVGVEEKTAGQAQSKVDMHSLRRFFIKSARDALKGDADKGIPPATGFDFDTIGDVVGHETESGPRGMTTVYSGKSTMAQRRACLAAVKLPTSKVSEEEDRDG